MELENIFLNIRYVLGNPVKTFLVDKIDIKEESDFKTKYKCRYYTLISEDIIDYMSNFNKSYLTIKYKYFNKYKKIKKYLKEYNNHNYKIIAPLDCKLSKREFKNIVKINKLKNRFIIVNTNSTCLINEKNEYYIDTGGIKNLSIII
jgi:hypothetical protein